MFSDITEGLKFSQTSERALDILRHERGFQTYSEIREGSEFIQKLERALNILRNQKGL